MSHNYLASVAFAAVTLALLFVGHMLQGSGALAAMTVWAAAIGWASAYCGHAYETFGTRRFQILSMGLLMWAVIFALISLIGFTV